MTRQTKPTETQPLNIVAPKHKVVSGLRPTKGEAGDNPKDSYGVAKVPYGTIPPTASFLMALAMGHGAEKYGAFNWRVSRVQALIYLEAAKRHLEALIDGQDFDVATGIPHIAFCMATEAIYADAWVNGMLIDNRPLPGKVGDLIERFNRKPGQAPMSPEEMQNAMLEIIEE